MRSIRRFNSGLLLFIIGIVVTSCSIQNRKYLPGVDVRWNKNCRSNEWVKSTNQNTSIAIENSASEFSQNENKLDIGVKQNETCLDFSKKKQELKFVPVVASNTTTPKNYLSEKKSNELTPDNPPENKNARMSMYFAAGSFVLLLIALGVGLSITPILILALILAEIFAAISIGNGVKSKNENIGKYPGRGLAKIGVIISTIIIIFLTIGLILLAIFQSILF